MIQDPIDKIRANIATGFNQASVLKRQLKKFRGIQEWNIGRRREFYTVKWMKKLHLEDVRH